MGTDDFLLKVTTFLEIIIFDLRKKKHSSVKNYVEFSFFQLKFKINYFKMFIFFT